VVQLYRWFPSVLKVITIIRPETVVRWHRASFRRYWRWNAFKIGRSEPGAKAAVSHTGALAGADRVYDELFKQLGVIRAQTFDGLLDIPVALATGRKLRGNRVAILTSTGCACRKSDSAILVMKAAEDRL
jgi:hypothetical protein